MTAWTQIRLQQTWCRRIRGVFLILHLRASHLDNLCLSGASVWSLCWWTVPPSITHTQRLQIISMWLEIKNIKGGIFSPKRIYSNTVQLHLFIATNQKDIFHDRLDKETAQSKFFVRVSFPISFSAFRWVLGPNSELGTKTADKLTWCLGRADGSHLAVLLAPSLKM